MVRGIGRVAAPREMTSELVAVSPSGPTVARIATWVLDECLDCHWQSSVLIQVVDSRQDVVVIKWFLGHFGKKLCERIFFHENPPGIYLNRTIRLRFPVSRYRMLLVKGHE